MRMPLSAEPPHPLQRQIITEPLETGVRAIDGLLTIGRGQRVGIFAGSGVGKSTLLGMIARQAKADVNVIALLGERGREVRDFIENSLGPEGLARSVIVVATGDQAALVRARGALVATSIAEYFRDQGKEVLLMVDSVTRVAMAWREIGLAVGEPPTTKGYPPSVFASLPRLLERAGTDEKGSITGIYTVLVDGDDFNEPIADASRSILDGHIVLTRKLAAAGHYPSIDILESKSRVRDHVITPEQRAAANAVARLESSYREKEDLILVGAYHEGSDRGVDAALRLRPQVLEFLQQLPEESTAFDDVDTARSSSIAQQIDTVDEEGRHERFQIPSSASARAPRADGEAGRRKVGRGGERGRRSARRAAGAGDDSQSGSQALRTAHASEPTIGQLKTIGYVIEQLNHHIVDAQTRVESAEQAVSETRTDLTSALQARRVLSRLRDRHFATWRTEDNAQQMTADGRARAVAIRSPRRQR